MHSKAITFFIGVLLLVSAGAFSATAQVRQEMRAPVQEEESDARGEEGRSPALDRQFHRALTAWRMGSSLEAKARLDHVLRERPSDVPARKLRAEVFLELDRPGDARQDAARAAQLRPQDGEAHLLHAEAAREDSRPDEARRALDRAAEHLPEEAALHTRFSWNAMLLGRLAQAEAFGRVALALDSTSAAAYQQLARVFIQRERADEAASVLARGLRARVVQPQALREDDLLRRLVDHPRLKAFMDS